MSDIVINTLHVVTLLKPMKNVVFLSSIKRCSKFGNLPKVRHLLSIKNIKVKSHT